MGYSEGRSKPGQAQDNQDFRVRIANFPAELKQYLTSEDLDLLYTAQELERGHHGEAKRPVYIESKEYKKVLARCEKRAGEG